jgi:hypothetical protein
VDRTITVGSWQEATAVVRRLTDRLAEKLADTRELRRGYAVEIMRQAQRNAVRRPTPQARGVAGSLRVRGGTVLGFPSTTITLSGVQKRAAGINFGAEYGSNTHAQFAPRNESGYWLNPAADEVDDRPGLKYLDDAISDSLRGIR